jgi:hypothetical protein
VRLTATQEYTDDCTLRQLRSFDLPAVLAAVRSYAVDGRRAPNCGIVDASGPTAAPTSQKAQQQPPPGPGNEPEGEQCSYRGVTRDNNGRQQYWVALLYASLE